MRVVLIFTRRLLVALSSGLVIFGVALALFWLLMGGWLATRMSSLANQHVFQDRTTRLHVGRITGSLFSNVIFENVRLERQIAGEWHSAVYADQLEARYDVWALLHGQSELKEVRVWQPLIEISEDSTGRWVLPVGNIPGDRSGARKQLLFSDVEIIGGKFRLIGRKRGWEAHGLDARATLRVDGEKVDLSLERASFTMLDPVGQVKELSGELHVDGRRLQGDNVRLFWEGSSLIGNFAWDAADSLSGLRVNADMLRIPLGRFKGLFDADAIPDSGFVSGGVRIAGGARHFDFETALSGQYDNWRVDSLMVAGRRDDSRFRFDRLGLSMPEARILSGEGSIDLARGGRLQASLDIGHVQVDSIPLKAVKWIPGVARGYLGLDISGFRKGYGPLVAGIDVDLDGERAFGVELAGARGRVDYVQGTDAEISDVVLTLPDGGTVTGAGSVSTKDSLDFVFTASTGDWSQLRPVIAIPGLRGSGEATGRLLGTGKSPVLDLSGTFRNVTGWEMAADSVIVERLHGPFVPEAEFDGTLQAARLHAIGRVIDHVDMDFEWREPRLTFPRLRATDNDTLLLTRGWADFDPPRQAMTTTLAGGSLAIGALEWTPEGPVVVDGLGTDWRVSPMRFRSPAGETTVEAFFETVAGTMDARFTGMRIDLAVMAGAEKPPEFGGGILSGDLRLAGPIVLPDPSGRLMFHDYRWADAVIDSALLDFAVIDRRLELSSGWADAGNGRLSFAGGADLPDHGWTLWNRWQDKEPIDWPRLILDNAEVWTDGVPMERWAAWNPDLKDLGGRASGRARLSGALASPEVRLSGRILNGARGAYEADTVEVAAAYGPDQLFLERLRIVRKDAVSIVSGDLPLRASIAPAKAELLDLPMNLDIDLPRSDLSVLPLLSPMIESAAGSLTGRVQLRGTPKHYLLYGGLKLAGGRLQVKNREEIVDHIEADVRFDSTTVSLISLSARQDSSQAEGSRLTGHGTFELGAAPERAYKLEIDLKRFVMRQSADYAARFDGHLEIVPLGLADGAVRPMMIGDIRLDRAEIVREFDQPQPVTEPGEALYYSLSIDAPRGIFIVNDDVDMELAGTLTARRTPDRSEMIGELSILRGTYTLLLRRFRIVNGRLNFNRVDVIDPEIDITAETNERDFIITVHLSGQASNPVIEFAARNSQGENITKNNDEILRLLAPGGALAGQLSDPGSNNSNINDLLGSVQLLFSEVQRDLARKLGVDEIRVDAPGPDDAFDVEEDGEKGPNSFGRVGVSKWITPDVSVSLSRGLSGTQASDLAVEYRLGRLLFLRGEIISRLYDVDRDSDDRRDEEYNVDLKFWYEY